MTGEKVLKALAPCGLSCEKCFSYTGGHIAKHARALKELLGNFDVYAERFTKLGLGVFADYPAFKVLLEYFAKGDCLGCREGTCKYPNCGVAACYKAKKMRFCYECEEFPCKKTNFDPHLETRWIAMNKRMKEVGPEAYYAETKNLPRYC